VIGTATLYMVLTLADGTTRTAFRQES